MSVQNDSIRIMCYIARSAFKLTEMHLVCNFEGFLLHLHSYFIADCKCFANYYNLQYLHQWLAYGGRVKLKRLRIR